MASTLIWDPLSMMLGGIAIAAGILCGCHYILRGRQREDRNERIIMYGYAGLFIFYSIGMIFINIISIFLIGFEDVSFTNNSMYGKNVSFSDPNYGISNKCLNVSLALAHLVFILSYEMTMKRTKYIISLINSTLLFIIIFADAQVSTLVYVYIFFPFTLFFVSIILINYIKHSHLEFKAVALMVFLGFIFLFNAIIFQNPMIKDHNLVPLYFSPLFFLIGIFLCFIPTIIHQKYFKRINLYLVMFSIVFNLLAVIFLPYFIINNIAIELLLLYGISTIFINIFIFDTYRKITSKEQLEAPKMGEITPALDYSQLLIKPQRVTEEEVTVSKEKKICLVCKGKLGRYNIFLCPECNTFYCSKCANALSDLENACWVCEAPFDESKPVRLPEKKEEEVIVKNDDFKKKKGNKVLIKKS